jgi:hypothetical protein
MANRIRRQKNRPEAEAQDKVNRVFSDRVTQEKLTEATEQVGQYSRHPSGTECISIVRWENFNLGTCIQHIWRIRGKDIDGQIRDLEVARWYLEDEIARLKGGPD